MKLRGLFFVILIMRSFMASSQGKSIEIGLVTDNDLYTSSKNDMYYTNGFEFFYRKLSKYEDENIKKRITELRLGQYIYNPRSINADDIRKNDRPFAGYLFAKIGKNIFYQNESVFKMDVSVGFVGPNSFAEETQKGFHALFNYKKVRGWQHQIKNALAVQTHVLFSKKLASHQNIDFNFQSEANLGTVLTGISTGFITRISLKELTPIFNSNLHGASLNQDIQKIKSESEFYFYIAPSLNYQLYDATIQGSLFNSNSPVTYDLIPFRFNGESGFKYRKNNLNLTYAFLYRGKELRNNSISGYFYGSISLSYLLK
jgi:hypothetical protein